MTKIVYIAHPISGDVQKNIESVINICKIIHSDDIIPIAPYILGLKYLNDSVTEDRALGIVSNSEYFKRKFMDETWLCGNNISKGVAEEIKLSIEYNIPILCYNLNLKPDLNKLIAETYKNNSSILPLIL